MSCPFCHLGGGFHDEDLHAKNVTVPHNKLLPIASEIRKANEDICGNCGGSYNDKAIPPCRNPKHI